jgi:hypothetical protein
MGHVTCMGGKRNAYRIWKGTPEGKLPLGRPRRDSGRACSMHGRKEKCI